jgi:hypothetical protein
MQLTDQPEVRVVEQPAAPGDQSEAPARIAPARAQAAAWLDSLHCLASRVVTGIFRRPAALDSSAASSARSWTDTLERVIADLDLLNRTTERDFLTIGGKLAQFIEKVNQISSQLAVLATFNTQEQGLHASLALTHALDRSTEMKVRYADHNGVLGGMRDQAGRLKEILSGFQGTVSTFHTLGVLTRIETARLGKEGADFGSLSDDVNLLAGNVQVRVEGALDAAALLIPSIETALLNISGVEDGEAQDLPVVIAGIMDSLSAFRSFRDVQDRAQASSLRLGTQYAAILGDFKKLIVSVQFHDLTRQQVEHVIEVLRRLCSESAGPDGKPGDRRGAAGVLALQSSQLAHAGEKFAASAASVADNLDDIATRVMEMVAESQTLSGSTKDEKDSFFLQMERGCTFVMNSLSHCATAEAAARVTSGGLAASIDRMRGSVEEVRAMEIEMQRIALNASIRAAHIGVSGDALGVLAGSMGQQAAECGERSESLGAALGSMSEAATRLSVQGARSSTGEGGGQKSGKAEGGLEEMRSGVVELHSSSERSFAQIEKIVACGARLREDLSATRQGFAVGALFAAAVSRARDMLEEIGARHPADLPPDGSLAPDYGLRDFAGHYTMQSELDVHDVHQGLARAEVTPAESSEPLSAEAAELGENVEFF